MRLWDIVSFPIPDPRRDRRARRAAALLLLTTALALSPRPGIADSPPVAGDGASADSSSVTSDAAATVPAASQEPAEAPRAAQGHSAPVAHAVAPPADLGDIDAWIEYRRAAHRDALPDEARLFYRRGLLASRAGQPIEAVRLVRGAATLDPGFVAPHLTLTAWELVHDPSQSLQQLAATLNLLRRDFTLQYALAANLAFWVMHVLFVGMVLVGLGILFLRQAELRHMCEERLARFMGPDRARLWTVPLLLLPFFAGLGLALPALALLGLLWPVLRSRERTFFLLLAMTCAVAPLGSRVLGRLALPLRAERAPFYGVADAGSVSWTPARERETSAIAAQNPRNPVVQFALGWTARQGDHLAVAEAAYRHARELRPRDARILNNLANVLAVENRPNEAIALYREALSRDPDDAAIHFNLSQAYTRQFDYRAASDAAARASALDFDLVKTQQALGTDDGVLPLVDEWLSPATLWTMLLAPVPGGLDSAIPPSWRGHVETAGWPFGAIAIVIAIAAVITGLWWQRGMPLRPCHNCGRVVCRRCAQRRRELALCATCATVAARAESPEFSNVLLGRQRLAVERSQRAVRAALAALLPGFGLLAFHRVFRATVLVMSAVLLSAPWLGVTAPFPLAGVGIEGASTASAWFGWVTLYAASLLGYFSESARAARRAAEMRGPVRSRPSQTPGVTARAA